MLRFEFAALCGASAGTNSGADVTKRSCMLSSAAGPVGAENRSWLPGAAGVGVAACGGCCGGGVAAVCASAEGPLLLPMTMFDRLPALLGFPETSCELGLAMTVAIGGDAEGDDDGTEVDIMCCPKPRSAGWCAWTGMSGD